jgi:maltose/maltodextrin transport system substrate-binding protein
MRNKSTTRRALSAAALLLGGVCACCGGLKHYWTFDGKTGVPGTQDWTALNALASEQTLTPLRPGRPGGSPFWNKNARAFIHAPAFEFHTADHAVAYRFTAHHRASATDHIFTADTPWCPLTNIWAALPVGYIDLTVAPLDGAGEVLEGSQTRSFYRAACFSGPYAAGARPYREAAKRCFAGVYALGHVQSWRETGKPSESYELYCYPAKMVGALIDAMLAHAELAEAASERANALAVARAAADWLIANSRPADGPLAYLPPTYWGNKRTAAAYKGQNMMIYPPQVALSYLKLYDATQDAAYRVSALHIADTLRNLQLAGGSWYLKIRESDGVPVGSNIAIPEGYFAELFERAAQLTGDEAYRTCAARTRQYVMAGPFVTYNWEAQFEDMQPTPSYENLEKGKPAEFSTYLFALSAAEPARLAQARELLAWCEDQFVVWSQPLTHLDSANWKTPCALEQYGYYTPIDASLADMIRAFANAYDATGDRLYAAKAMALADTVTRMQRPDGTIPTYFDSRAGTGLDWLNCMVFTAQALMRLDEVISK